MTPNYNDIETQVASEVTNELGYRIVTNLLTIHDMQTKRNINIPYENILNKYRYFLQDHIMEIELTEVQYETFRQNPQAMSEFLYDNIHLWHSLLELNHCVSRTEFNIKKVRYYDPLEIERLLNEVELKEDQLNQINIF